MAQHLEALEKNPQGTEDLQGGGWVSLTSGSKQEGGVNVSKVWSTGMDFRAVQKAVVHGARDSCDGSRFPPIFVRLDDYDVLSWVYEVAFPGKSLAATKPEPERPIARPPPRPQRPPPQPQGPSIDPFGTSDSIQGGKNKNHLFALKEVLKYTF